MKPTLATLLTLLLLTPAILPAADAPQKPAPTAAAKPKWQKPALQTPAGYTCITQVVATYPEHTVDLVLYVPDKPGAYPAILDIHGGGWKARQVEADRPMMERLAAQGFVTALVSYRLSTEAKYPAALHDCKAALRHLRAHAKELKIDPSRIGIIGGSAGGHLSGLVGMTSGMPEFEGTGPAMEQPSTVQACVVMAGSQDLVASNKDKTGEGAQLFFGQSCQENPALYAAASGITHVRAGVPPTIFIEGEKDTLKIGRAEMMEKLKAVGVETAIHTLPGAPHPFWMSQPWCDETVAIAGAFFKKHLGEPKL